MYKIQKIRSRYQEKRRSKKWKNRKKQNLLINKNKVQNLNNAKQRKLINYPAPDDFSLINNTDEVVKYFYDIRKFISKKSPVFLDISEITNLTPDSIALQMAELTDKKNKKIGMFGNAPNNPKFKKMFEESGLYDHVISSNQRVNGVNNRLWKHSSDNHVKGEIAGEAVEICREKFILNNKSFDTDSIYNLLVEAMSNTKTHAKNNNKRSNKNKPININWWLYYYIDEEKSIIKYSFIDLGIGIFQSASFKAYKKQISYYLGNTILIKPFLEGKIVSSRKNDHEISGKGVRQIMQCSQMQEIVKFYIISNDLKIDVKNQDGIKLSTNFAGTFIYFEISYN